MPWDSLLSKKIGRVLKIVSFIWLVLGVIGSIVIAVYMYDNYYGIYEGEAVAIFLTFFLITLLEAILMYAFAQITEDVHKIADGRQGVNNTDNSELPNL
ncbi:MAG: hypothetical protein IKG74_00445 [Firmicutes bacterium]|nr:hypothetical protein [Bacillota bacterium]